MAGALQYVDHPGYAALILRRTFADLALPGAIMARSHEWLTGHAHWSGQEKTWTFPSGATITFGYLEHDNDIYRYQSTEFQYIAFDELTHFLRNQYVYLFSRLRKRKSIDVPLRMRAGSNPGGVGHGWVLNRFPIEYGKSPETNEGRIFVPAKVADNPGLDEQEYAVSLSELDDVARAQLLNGDWGAAEGLAFKYQDALHSVQPFDIPADWLRLESLDHGLANPTCDLAWASDTDGNLIVFDSYYSPRNQMISDHARELLKLRPAWWPKDPEGYPIHTIVCHADHDLWGKTGTQTEYGDPATLITEYAAHGVDTGWVQANKDPKAGRARLLELMRPDPDRPFPPFHARAGEKGSPRLFVVAKNCPELVEQLKVAPTNPDPTGKHGAGEIVDPKWEGRDGHASAAARYGALAWLPPSEKTAEEPADPRARAVRRMVEAEREEDEDGYGSYA